MSDIITILAMDVGDKRIGLAVANSLARLTRALPTIERGVSLWQEIKDIVTKENIQQFVVGLPRSLDGKVTPQTRLSQDFAEELKNRFNLPVVMQDEALTSWQAEKELAGTGKSYGKGQIDALSAVYILEDYLREHYDGVKQSV